MFWWWLIFLGSILWRVDKDDEFDGVKIGKGVVIIVNVWGIGCDRVVFDLVFGDL